MGDYEDTFDDKVSDQRYTSTLPRNFVTNHHNTSRNSNHLMSDTNSEYSGSRFSNERLTLAAEQPTQIQAVEKTFQVNEIKEAVDAVLNWNIDSNNSEAIFNY